MLAGHTYTLKLELYPVLAAADRIANRDVAADPLVYELDTKLHVVDDSEPELTPKATTKSRKAGSGSGSGSGSTSSSSKSKSRSSARRSSHSRRNTYVYTADTVHLQTADALLEQAKPYVALPL